MPQPETAAAFYLALQRLQLLLIGAGRYAWSQIGADFDPGWDRIAPALLAVTAAAQQRAAAEAASYVPAVLEELGQPDQPDGELRPRAFGGTAADGRTLDGLLFGAVTTTKTAVGTGQPVPEALAIGGRWLDGTLSTVVSDAGRQAAGAAVAQRRNMGWVRMVNPPCCSRCAILAGRWYRWSEGFSRHKRCDCVHIPTAEDSADDVRTDPQALLDQGLITDLSQAQGRAIADGADFARVINADRGMYTTTVFGRRVQATTEATTARGAGRDLGDLTKLAEQRYRRSSVVRLTPESIYELAADREDAVRLLRRNGYIT